MAVWMRVSVSVPPAADANTRIKADARMTQAIFIGGSYVL